MPLAYPISDEFTSFNGTTNTGKPKVFSVCNHCGFNDNIRDQNHINQISKGKLGSTRIKAKYNHLQECEIASQAIKDKYTKEGKLKSNQQAQQSQQPVQSQSRQQLQSQQSQQLPQQQQPNQDENEELEKDWTDPSVRNEAKRLLGEFLFHHALPWNPFTSVEWKKFIKYLCPEFNVVYRDEISNNLLDNCYDDTKKYVSRDL